MKTRLPIFKPGKHRAMDGRVYEFSAAVLAQVVEAYDPAVLQAPHVLGHPKTDDPAWAWVKSIGVDDDGMLFCEQEQIDPAFADGVEAGRYKFRSAAFYGPNDPANPKPGGYYLKHVGWLGAAAPAVKGLGPAFSAEAGEDVIEFADGVADGFWVKDILRGLRDWMIDKFSLDEANKVIPAWAIENVDREGPKFAEEPAPEPPAAPAATAIDTSALDARAAALDARETAVAEREGRAQSDQVAFAEAGRQAARDDDGAFVDQLVGKGHLPPARADQVKTLLAVLDGDQVVAFAEGAPGARDQLRELLGGLGQSIVFGEVAPGDGVRFSENPTAEQVADQIRDEQAKAAERGETLSASQAAGRLAR